MTNTEMDQTPQDDTTTLLTYDDVMEAYGDDPKKAAYMLDFLDLN